MFPVLFKIGTFEVRTFGLMLVIGFFAGIWLGQKRAAKFGLDKSAINDLCTWAIIAGVLGARIVFILQELPHYLKHPAELLTLRFSGLTSFGGLLFGMAAVIVWARLRKVSIVTVLDLIAPSFLLGHIFGRIGCFMNGCCYGGECDSHALFAVHFADAPGYHVPAQIFDALMNVAALGILLAWEKRGLRFGQIFSATLILHGLTRFIYEFWRAGTEAQVASGQASSTYWGALPITQAQAMAGVLILAGLVSFLLFSRRAAQQRLQAA